MKSDNKLRILFIAVLFVILFIAALGRLFYLQVWRGEDYRRVAQNQQSVAEAVLPERGNVYLAVRNNQPSTINNQQPKEVPLALTKTWYDIWVSPREIADSEKENVAQGLSRILGLDFDSVKEKIFKPNDPYEPIKNKVDKQVTMELEKLDYKGVHWKTTHDRYYPLGELAAQVVGFVSPETDNPGANASSDLKTGKYGLEGYYNNQLQGQAGFISGFKKALGSLILPLSQIVKPKKGQDIYLTLDYNIQLTLERELKKATKRFSAEGASAIVLDPKTGAVLALANWPNFDPNKYNEVKNPSVFLNTNTQLVFEPGSIFKPITMAAAVDVNVVSPDLKYFDSGEVNVSGFTIRNSTRQAWGEQTMTQVLEKSLNTGAIFALRRMPQGVWREYVKNFGLAEKTGIELSGETKGNIDNLISGVEIDWVTSAFGQGISVTPLAMADAVGVIANGGELLKPYLVSKIVDGDKVVFEGGRVVKRRVIKTVTSQTLTKMLINAVENGSGRQARIPGYSVAGKTGTAQVASPAGGYTDKTIHTFVGYSPAFDPKFLMLIRLDNPRGVEFSEASAAPVFKSVGEFILHYLNVKPDKPLK